MKKLVKVLKEIGIALAFLLVISLAATIIFIDKIPLADEIPEPEIYVAVDRDDYLVSRDGIENAESETVIYESTVVDLETYGSELRYISGRTEPLTKNEPGKSDIPTDIIQIQ